MTTTRRAFLGLVLMSPFALALHPVASLARSPAKPLVTLSSRWEAREEIEIVSGQQVEVVLESPIANLMIGQDVQVGSVRFELENFWRTASGKQILCGRLIP